MDAGPPRGPGARRLGGDPLCRCIDDVRRGAGRCVAGAVAAGRACGRAGCSSVAGAERRSGVRVLVPRMYTLWRRAGAAFDHVDGARPGRHRCRCRTRPGGHLGRVRRSRECDGRRGTVDPSRSGRRRDRSVVRDPLRDVVRGTRRNRAQRRRDVARTSGVLAVQLGHHRPAEGRHPSPRQPAGHVRFLRHTRSGYRPRRPMSVRRQVVLRVRSWQLADVPVRRRCDQRAGTASADARHRPGHRPRRTSDAVLRQPRFRCRAAGHRRAR